VSEKRKPGGNDPCWCGSGKKYKNCHMRQDQAEAKRSATKPVPASLGVSKPPVPPEIAASNARWEQFEAADLKGKVALFLETLTSGEMGAEEAYEMLQGIREESDPRYDPEARARYAELLERLRQEAPDLYRHDLLYYHDNLISDAIAEGRWEAIPELLAGFAEMPDQGIDLFFRLLVCPRLGSETTSARRWMPISGLRTSALCCLSSWPISAAVPELPSVKVTWCGTNCSICCTSN